MVEVCVGFNGGSARAHALMVLAETKALPTSTTGATDSGFAQNFGMTRTRRFEVSLDTIAVLQIVMSLSGTCFKGMTSVSAPPIQVSISAMLKVRDFAREDFLFQVPDSDFVDVVGRLQHHLCTGFTQSSC